MQTIAEENINLSKKKIEAISKHPEKTAAAIDLVYVNDSHPGIQRIKKGKGFTYLANGKKLNDKNTFSRIKSLVIPPAWENVWICIWITATCRQRGLM